MTSPESGDRAVDVLDARLVELGSRYGITLSALAGLRRLADLVATDPLAPTTVRDLDGILRDHIADSLAAAELPALRTATAIADLGSGAGFPGLPLALALSTAEVTLVESSARKCSFIERAIAAGAISNARVVHARVESWPDGHERFDAITARALGPLPVVAEYAAPLLRVGGTLIVWRGRRDSEAEEQARAAAAELGLEVGEIRRVQPYPTVEHRHLHLLSKVRPTPQRFPRRPGIASKRPLGSTARTSDRVRR